jgi:hypothetical protein
MGRKKYTHVIVDPPCQVVEQRQEYDPDWLRQTRALRAAGAPILHIEMLNNPDVTAGIAYRALRKVGLAQGDVAE